MTKIVRMHALGGPEVLKIDEIDVPAPGPNEVRIRIAAIGLNRVEAMFRNGEFGTAALPSRIGYEAAGTIDAVGSAVREFAPGDRVAVLPGISMPDYGTYGEAALCPADMLIRLTDSQSMTESAATWMQYLTAYALVGVAHVKAGDAVVITAASSSVGLAAIQIVNAAGGISIAVTRGRGKVDALRAQGAAHVIVSDEQDLTQTIRNITAGRGAEIVFDAVAGKTLEALVTAMAIGGFAIVYGSLGGDSVALQTGLFSFQNLTVRGFAVNYLLTDPQQRRAAIAYVHDGLARGTLRPVIDRTFPLSDIVAAHRYLEGNTQLGKIVVTV